MENPQFAKIGRSLKTRHAVVELQANAKVTPDDILNSIKGILEKTGCTACGMNGFDIHLHGVRPGADIATHFKGFDSSRVRESIEIDPMEFNPIQQY